MRSISLMMTAFVFGGAVVVSSVYAGNVQSSKKYPFQNLNYTPYSQSNELSETALLNRLDKDGRSLYYSLNEESKQYARELAAQSEQRGERRAKDFKKTVETAAAYMDTQRIRIQDRRLHNGMDRLSEKIREW